jgi:hypothetical protein
MNYIEDELGKFSFDENGKLNSFSDNPAAIYKRGTRIWYKNGEIHRDAGPAVVYSDGKQEWYKNGKLHRDDGPAIQFPDTDDIVTRRRNEIWYKDGKLHNLKGPAEKWQDGTERWHIEGKPLTDEFRDMLIDVLKTKNEDSLIAFYNLFLLKNI